MSAGPGQSLGCVSELTLAIGKTRAPGLRHENADDGQGSRDLDSSDSGSGNSGQAQPFESTDDESQNGNIDFQEPLSEDLRIPIIGYEVMEERARFTVYKLRVEFKSRDCWFVFRRYTDFVRLLTQLKRQKASISHLSLPRKKWLGDNFAPTFLEERIRGLQAFVNGLLNSPDLITLPCVREFFCLDEPPALSDTVEESRAIFEALEDTIYHLRQQLRERESALAAETNLCNELRKKLHNVITESQICAKCGANNNYSELDDIET